MQSNSEWEKRVELAKRANSEVLEKVMRVMDTLLLEMIQEDKKEGERERVCKAKRRFLERKRQLREWRRRKRN